MKKLTDIIAKGVKKVAVLGATIAGLAFGAESVQAQNQLRVFSPKHVTADNPQGIVTGGYNSSTNTANYEDELSRLKSTAGGWYGDQIVNPFIRPGYRDKNMGKREYYGSKDANGNHIINELADVLYLYDGHTSYRGDVNADGVSNLVDAYIIQQVYKKNRDHAPSDWPYLNEAEKIDYVEKIVKLDKIDSLYSHSYATSFWLKFAGLEISEDYYNFNVFNQFINMAKENGYYNLPAYKVSTRTKNGEDYSLISILVGDNPTNFEDWYFIDPKTDKKVKPGDFLMDNQEGMNVGMERLCYYYHQADKSYRYDDLPIISFSLHDKSPPTLAWKHPELVISRPGNPVSGIENNVNSFGENNLSIYPNPIINDQNLTVINSTGQFRENGELTIYNLVGQLIYRKKPELNRENKMIISSDKINSLARGTYIINYLSPQQKSVAKFEKQKP